MVRFQVITEWTVLSGRNYPRIGVDHALISWVDVTGQNGTQIPTDPAIYIVEAIADDSVYDQIDADPNVAILWSENYTEYIPDGTDS